MDEGSSSPASYIRLVQHLIEKCICYKMNREECMETLEKHAKIMPVITSTVWKELEKENREFFETYKKDRGEDSVQKSPLDAQESASNKSSDDDKQGRTQNPVKPLQAEQAKQGWSQLNQVIKPQAEQAKQGWSQNQVKPQAEQANTRLSSC